MSEAICSSEKNVDDDASPEPDTTTDDATIINISDSETLPCRICLCNDIASQSMISPCLCKGSIGNVHKVCLEQWLSQKGNNSCDLCKFEFTVYSVQRYSMLESIGKWIKHPSNRAYFIYDSVVFLVLNMLTGVVISMFLRNVNAMANMPAMGGDGVALWFLATGVAAVLFWSIVYGMAVSLYVNAQVRPWYHWWKSARTIRLVANV